MPTTDTNVPQVIVNKLTKAQYEAATKSSTEFYVVPDEQIGTSDIADGAVTAGKIDFTTFMKVGSIALPSMAGSISGTQTVNFATPFPDANYKILTSLTSSSSDITNYTFIRMTSDSKTANGFAVHYYNSSTTETTGTDFKIDWMAIKI